MALPLQRRKSQSYDIEHGRTLKSQPSFREYDCDYAEATPSCPRGACGASMLLGASKQGHAIFNAMTTSFYCDGPEREHGACNERWAKDAALSAATAPHLLHRPHVRSTFFTGLSATSASRLLVFMRYSVALEVIPHSATSRATGVDTSSIMSWNSGV